MSTRDEGLVRAIGPVALGLTIVNLIVGGGIFALPGVIAAQLGPAAILAYLVCSVAVALVYLCFAEAGTRITRSGGSYAYVEEAFGPFAGFLTSTLLWLGYAAFSDAAITVAMVETIAIAVPVVSQPMARMAFIVALFSLLAAINIKGVKEGVRFVVFNTVAKLIPLSLLLVVGLFAIEFEHVRVTQWPTLASVGSGTIVLFFAFSGGECALNASGEIKDPRRAVPTGILLGLTGVFALYAGLQTVAQGVLGPELALNTEAPLVATATRVLGDWGAKLLLVGGVVSIYAAISGDMLSAPRVIFASARDGHLPAFLASVHPRFRTPHVAVIFYAVAVAALALSGTFRTLAVMASAALLTVDAGVCLAVLRLRRVLGPPAEGELTLPFGPLIPVMALSIVGWLLWQLSREETLMLGALLGVAAAVYAVRLAAGRATREPA